MSTLDDLQKNLAAVRAQRAAVESGFLTARAVLARPAGRGGDRAAAVQNATQLRAQRDALLSQEASLLGQIAILGDPTKLVEHLDDAVPFVLFPVRLETRFMHVGAAYQLWVRIYPDDCQIQTFTDVMTDAELSDVRAFWCDYWKAGGIELQQRAAWKSLVAAHGSGRSEWLVKGYRPTGNGPAKARPDDVILVVPPNLALTATEQTAATAFWIAWWRAGTDANAQKAALSALTGAVGAARAVEVQTSWKPHNLADPPTPPQTLASTGVSLVPIVLPPTAGLTTSPTSWQQAPRVTTLPDCFVVTGTQAGTKVFSTVGKPIPGALPVGPDPSLPDDEQIKSANGELTLNKELRWLADFDEAIACGMGVKIDLTAAQFAAGFDRLVVLGLRLSADATHGAQLLESLLSDHRVSQSGLSILPQGTPTNNTDGDPSGYTWVDDPDESFDRVFGTAQTFPLSADPQAKRDGQVLAETLGLDPSFFAGVAHADGLDQAHARALNTALWPTTWGYFFEEMLGSMVPSDTVEHLRTFFIRYVSGRGAVPAIRIGKQPYGVLPTTVHSRLDFADHRPPPPAPPPAPAPSPGRVGGRDVAVAAPSPAGVAPPIVEVGPPIARAAAVQAAVPPQLIAIPRLHLNPWPLSFLDGLQKRIRQVDNDFASSRGAVAFVGKPGDPLQTLLDLIGLHPASVEYYQRYAESVTQAFNEFSLKVGPFWAGLFLGALQDVRKQILQGVGIDPADKPPILDKIFYDAATLLTGPVVDDLPLSEVNAIRAYTNDGRNYLSWLGQSTLDVIQRQDFGGKPVPNALLYLFARQATMLAYWDTSVNLMVGAKLLDDASARKDVEFIGVSTQLDGASKWQYLESPQPTVTGEAGVTLGQYIDRPSVFASSPAAARLREVKTALGNLAQASTASLERLFAEHIDVATYRIDAWKQSLVEYRADDLRGARPTGIYLGAYGWVENLRPEANPLTKATLPAEVAPAFGSAPVWHDPSNGGYIHAPSLNHAVAAAVLKNGYLTHATPATPDAMSVNLSSERVRLAMAIVQGMWEGQGLAELLGYQFERGLHDRHNLDGVEAERFLYGLRCKFPLTARKLQATQPPANTPVDNVESRNVVDGLALIEHVRTTGQSHYPFGLPTGTGASDLLAASATQAKAIDDEVARLDDAQDAVADLMMAESVYQAVQGQSARAAAATDVIGKGHFPAEPEVIRTPRSGTNLTHRVAIHLDAAAAPSAGATPRATAEPALDAWLAGRLPALSDVSVSVTWTDPASGAAKTAEVTIASLGLRAIDLLYLGMLDGHAAMNELDDRIAEQVHATLAPHPGASLVIGYTTPIDGKPSVFEVGALIRQLNPLLLGSRALAANDLAPSLQGATVDPRWDLVDLASRLGAARTSLGARVSPLSALAADNATAPEGYLAQAVTLLLDVARFGAPQTGIGDWRSQVSALYQSIAARLQVLLARWTKQRTECAALLASLPSLADDDARVAALVRAERLVSANATTPRPDAATYRTIVSNALAAFDGARTSLAQPLGKPYTRLADFIAELEPLLATVATYDPVFFDVDRKRNDLGPERDALTTLRATVQARVAAVAADVQARVAAAGDLISQAQASSDARKAQKLLTDAARRVLGDAACVLPRFTVTSDQAGTLDSAFAASPSLLQDVAKTRAFPVDDWLYGAARVRTRLAQWEQAGAYAEAFGAAPAELTPLQLPFNAGDRWAALELPDGYALGGDKLLYTAAFAQPLDPTQAQCGLVVDEWTEVVPGDSEVTGLAFHFGAPTTQPPQAILVATTPRLTGAWQWTDLIDALTETMDQAKLRAIEPAQIAGSLYSQFLPATIMAVTRYLITISTNLADNLKVTN